MSLRVRMLICAAWLVSLWTVAVIAQNPRVTTPEGPPDQVFSGSEFGFRLEGYESGTPVGTLVIRVKGRWVPVEERLEPQVRRTAR